ncbi:MAG: diguanylate cyclase [Clostridia bacterium]|nr:diguanylate cyclase [Clostridia bacterium]MDY5554848.1 diguanylate cyclase [Blautia sp.]
MGHAEGDKLIINSYKVIKSKFPGVDVYRIGGDEFVIFIEKHTAVIAEKLVAEFRTTMTRKLFNYGENSNEAIVSCGYALYDPETDASCEDTFNRADRDMYEDKERFYKASPYVKRRVY